MPYTVNIIGTTWGGFQSAYSYNFAQALVIQVPDGFNNNFDNTGIEVPS